MSVPIPSKILSEYSSLFSNTEDQPKTELELKLRQQSTKRRWGLAIFIIGTIGFIIMFAVALFSNQNLISLMDTEITNCNDITCQTTLAYAQILGSRVSGVRLALANSFPVLSKFLGYQNSYTPSLIAGMFNMYGFKKTVLIEAMFMLETGLTVAPLPPGNAYPNPPTLWQTVFQITGQDPSQFAQGGLPPNSAGTQSPSIVGQIMPYFNIFCQIAGLALMAFP